VTLARFAAIDIGSNALRLRIVEVSDVSTEKGAPLTFREVLSQRAAVRLGTEVFFTGELPPAAIAQACDALRDFRRMMDIAKVDAYRATATSAVRDAKNSALLIERANREASIDIEIIEGIEEARLVRVAVTRRLDLETHTAVLVDVGGGSAEFTLLERGEHVFSLSLPLGSVRMLETYLKGATSVSPKRIKQIDDEVDRGIAEFVLRSGAAATAVSALVGTGGNVDTLAELCPKPGPERAIDTNAMQQLVQELAKLTPEERKERYKLRSDRADTIVPASRVFLRAANAFNVPKIFAPGVGLKEGILIDLIDRHFHTWYDGRETQGVLDACLRLGRRFRFDEAHGVRVSNFALQIFDATEKLHKLTERDRLLLHAAAVLHDVGDYVKYDGHHKHSYYLIRNSDLMGLSREERAVVANIARYHRKGGPELEHPNYRELTKPERNSVRVLCSIVRVADALDREHLGKVREVAPRLTSKSLYLGIHDEATRESVEWSVQAKSDLFREIFGLAVETGA
jgi:exopolyphosphatase / guanosine-5'-triphosphate,3'-diphosphate pyrophosphatase